MSRFFFCIQERKESGFLSGLYYFEILGDGSILIKPKMDPSGSASSARGEQVKEPEPEYYSNSALYGT